MHPHKHVLGQTGVADLIPEQLHDHLQIEPVRLELARVRQGLFDLLLLRGRHIDNPCYGIRSVGDSPDVRRAHGNVLAGAKEVKEWDVVLARERLIASVALWGLVCCAAPAFAAIFGEGVGLEEGGHVFLVEANEGVDGGCSRSGAGVRKEVQVHDGQLLEVTVWGDIVP
jgi:hypothetical protein